MRPLSTPVIMYHSVSHGDKDWIWNELVCPVGLFSGQLARLVARGYRAITLDDYRQIAESGARAGTRQVVLTFDDGYLDNWVYVFPLLRRIGWRGVVYVNPEFVDPGAEPRPTLQDVWDGRCSERDLRSRGFLNWAELAELDRSGVLEIASHSMSHTWYPIGPEIVDFHRPGLVTPWLAWNARPERKPHYLVEDQSSFVPWGEPVHRSGRSLGIRRWFPDPDIAVAATSYVAESGGSDFFGRPDWRARLDAVVREADQGRGRLESDVEMRARFAHEVEDASRILSRHLGRPVRHFCWPGGAYCDEAWKFVDAADFATVTIRRSDPTRGGSPDPRFVRRISDYRTFSFRGRINPARDPAMLADACDVELGRHWARWSLRARKAAASFGQRAPRRPAE